MSQPSTRRRREILALAETVSDLCRNGTSRRDSLYPSSFTAWFHSNRRASFSGASALCAVGKCLCLGGASFSLRGASAPLRASVNCCRGTGAEMSLRGASASFSSAGYRNLSHGRGTSVKDDRVPAGRAAAVPPTPHPSHKPGSPHQPLLVSRTPAQTPTRTNTSP